MELDTKQSQKERYANIDLLKTIAIIMVIICIRDYFKQILYKMLQ